MKFSHIGSRFASLLFTSIFLVSAISCGTEKLQDGVFSGIGEGRNGPIEVSVTVRDGKVAAAKIVRETETPEIGAPAQEAIISQFIQDGKTDDIDVVSGATLTSEGLLDALDAALDASKGKTKKSIAFSDTSCDIVIIGAGGAGLTAATEAAHQNAKVIVLEKMGIVGGNTNYSTGGINAAYTKEQERLGIKDSKDIFFHDTMEGGKNINDPALVQKLVDESAGIVEWLQSPLIGADLSDVGMFGGATNKRIHRPQGGAAIGAHLVPLLFKAARAQGAEIRLNNTVTDIIEKDGRAVGVKVSSEGGNYVINAKAVIIASGGFGANTKMIEKYQPSLKGFATTNHRGATGDAFAMVEKFDAGLTQMEQIQTHPTVVVGTGIMITESVRGNGAILVNRTGRRFVDEMENRDVVSSAVLRGPGKTAFLVFDQSVRDSLKVIESYANQGLLTEAATIKELADKLRIQSDTLESTITQYNSFVAAKKDADFGRNPASMERALSKAPYYAIEIEPAVHHTMGGLTINPSANVMTTDGLPIPGLFAAGEVTGGVHGANRLGGNAVADICVFGKIAADSAIRYIRD